MGNKSFKSNKEMIDSDSEFEAAYRSYGTGIYNFLFWRTSNTELSRDLASTTFEKAWMARKRFKKGSLQAWLYQIARNTLIDHWRKKKELPLDNLQYPLKLPIAEAAEVLDKQMMLEKLEKALQKLPSKMQTIIILRFIEEQSCQQVGEKLRLSEGNVRILQYRALKKLRGYLE